MSPSRKHPSRQPTARTKDRSKARESSDAKIPRTTRDKAAGEWFAKLVALQRRLRAPDGCPWDREQTHDSLRKFLIEEAYEVLDALESGDPRKFSSELGDLLLQIIFHSILAEETGQFTIADVIESVYTKMFRRHPHVFGDVKAKTSADVLKNWEALKAAERAEEQSSSDTVIAAGPNGAEESLLSGIPQSLPAVLEAEQLTRRVARIGFDWDNLPGLLDKLDEEKQELQSLVARAVSNGSVGANRDTRSGTHSAAAARPATVAQAVEEEVGDLLFVGVNIARFLDLDPEIALKKTNRKFRRRFEWMEAAAALEGHRFADLPRERMEALWNESKANT